MVSNAYIRQPRGNRMAPSPSSRIYWHLRCLARAMAQIVENQVASRRVSTLVDFGCGEMPYKTLFKPHVGEYKGADLEGNVDAEVTIENDGRLGVEDKSFDIVLSNQVLEHVACPETYLRECNRVLVDDGLLILSTHGVWQYHPDPTDYWRWTSNGLQKIITEHGFEILEFEGIMGPLATGIQLAQDAIYPSLPTLLRPMLTLPCQLAMQFADWLTSQERRNADASVYVVVAKRLGPGTEP